MAPIGYCFTAAACLRTCQQRAVRDVHCTNLSCGSTACPHSGPHPCDERNVSACVHPLVSINRPHPSPMQAFRVTHPFRSHSPYLGPCLISTQAIQSHMCYVGSCQARASYETAVFGPMWEHPRRPLLLLKVARATLQPAPPVLRPTQTCGTTTPPS